MIALAVAILAFFATAANAAVPSTHPFDPLSQQELASTVAVLKSAGHVDGNTRFVFLTLREPDKNAALKWKPAEAAAREAFVIIKQGGQTYEAIIDLPGQKLASWREVKGVQPALLLYDHVRRSSLGHLRALHGSDARLVLPNVPGRG